MKHPIKNILCAFTCLIFFSAFSYAEKTFSTGDTTVQKNFLDMKGQVTYGKKKLDKSFVKIYADTTSNIVQKMESDIGGWVAFQLPIQKTYTIKISKAGHVTKIISVDATMPKLNEGDYYFEFSVDLFENIEGLDVSVLKNPVAKIFFNTFTKKFDYDYNYTAKINNDVKKLYHDYELLKKQEGIPIQTMAKTENKISQTTTPDTSKKYVPANTITLIKSEPKIIFSVEILTSDEQVSRNSPRFKGIVNVKEYKEGDVYKYAVGEYPTKEDAEKMKDRITGYFSDMNIVSFKEGKKIAEGESSVPKER